MAKLMDIKGYWSVSFGPYNENDIWEGKILLNDDGWFEGIVVDPNSSYKGDRLVYGFYHLDKGIQLIKVAPKRVSNPFVFRGLKKETSYDGVFSVIRVLGEQGCGLCSITTEEFSKLKENTVDIEEGLKNRIAEFKEIDDFKTLYENTLQMKNEIIEILARSYDGRSFSEDETADIIEKFEPVNQIVAEETLKLLKKTSASYFMNEEDSDLPF